MPQPGTSPRSIPIRAKPRLVQRRSPGRRSASLGAARVLAGRLGQRQGEVVAGGLLGRDDQRVEVGRQPPVEQREVADVAEIDRQQLRRDPLGDLGVLLFEPLARVEDHLLDAVDREVVVRRQLAPAALVEAGDVRQLAEHEDQVLGIDRERLDRREERLRLRRRRRRLT